MIGWILVVGFWAAYGWSAVKYRKEHPEGLGLIGALGVAAVFIYIATAIFRP